MPSTYSALKIELIATGEQPGTWGNTTNVNLGSGGAGLEQAIVGMATLVTGDFTANSYTMPYNNTNGLQNFRALVLNITATLSGAGTITVPAIQKPYIVMNNSVGGFAVTVKVSGQPGISVPNGAKVLLYNDGTDVGTAITYLTTLTLGSPLNAVSGGTGQSSYTTGDLLFASSGTALSKLADVATGNALISGGVGVAPSYGKIGLTTHVSGTLPIGNGGTGLTTVPALSIPVANTLNTLTTVTGTAGQSIRVNAGGTAWEAYTPSTASGTVTSVSWTGGIVSIANPTTTPAFTIAGTSGGIPYFSSGTTWATSAALAANSLVIGGGAGVAPSTITTGTGVITALGVNTGSAGAFVVNGGALGTPSSGTVTNLTGTASININGTVGATTANTGNFTSIVSTSAAGILTRAAATQDGVELIGRAGGTTSLKVTLTPTTLTASRTLTLPDNSGTILTTGAVVTVAQGGTGLTTLTANNVILGNGTSTPTFVAPGTNGNVLTSNGTTWVSSAPAGGSAATPTALGSVYADTIAASPFDTFLGYQAGNVSTGVNNTFIGYQAGLANTTGTNNTAVGYQTLDSVTTGQFLTGMGSGALATATTGSGGTAFGYQAATSSNGLSVVAVGYRAAYSQTTSSSITAIGYEAYYSTTSDGDRGVAVGYQALRANTTGADNIAVGYQALDANTTGANNVAIGSNALGANTVGTNNTAVGHNSLDANTIGQYNVAMGSNALGSNTTGSSNTAVGYQSLNSNTIGEQNTAVGQQTLFSNTTGIRNTAVGQFALYSNTTGGENTAVGYLASYSNTTGIQNTAVGRNALNSNTASNNSAFGYNALTSNTTGANNTAVGNEAGDQITTGTQNTIIGTGAASSGTNDLTTGSNNIILGYNAAATSATVSNETTIGNSSTTSARIFGDLKFLNSYTETVFAVTGTTPALSPTNGTIQTWTLSGSSTPTQGTWVAGQSMTLQITAGANTITWSSIPVTWIGGSAPTLSTTGLTIIELWEVGTTIYGALVGTT